MGYILSGHVMTRSPDSLTAYYTLDTEWAEHLQSTLIKVYLYLNAARILKPLQCQYIKGGKLLVLYH